jgi:hypothetical protein
MENRFLAVSTYFQNFHAHSRLALRQWWLAPHRIRLKILRLWIDEKVRYTFAVRSR